MKSLTPLIEQLEAIQRPKLWMGDSFEKKLNSITKEEAFIQLNGNVHSVAQLIAHLSAWKEDAI